jgi:hypothetical protein
MKPACPVRDHAFGPGDDEHQAVPLSLPPRRTPRANPLTGGIQWRMFPQHIGRSAYPGLVQGMQQRAPGTPANPSPEIFQGKFKQWPVKTGPNRTGLHRQYGHCDSL